MTDDKKDIKRPKKSFDNMDDDDGGRSPYGYHEGRYKGPHENIPEAEDHAPDEHLRKTPAHLRAMSRDFSKAQEKPGKTWDMPPEFREKMLKELKKAKARAERGREQSRDYGRERTR